MASSYLDTRVIQLKGLKYSVGTLANVLPDVETALFFGKAMELSAGDLGTLLSELFKTPLANALFNEGSSHSLELQDYLVDIYADLPAYTFTQGAPVFGEDAKPPRGEILPQVWEQLDIEIAETLAQVTQRLSKVLDKLPGAEGRVHFQHMAKVSKQRPKSIGVFQARIEHQRNNKNLVILDVSGSMSAYTIENIVDDVVALAYKANASLAIVSNTTQVWGPGAYNTRSVLNNAEYGGTQYETLAPLLDEDWDCVITIADYDSAPSAKAAVQLRSKGHVSEVLDISLVDRPTYLSTVVGTRADHVRPLLMAQNNLCY